jgi:hypothetical protein
MKTFAFLLLVFATPVTALAAPDLNGAIQEGLQVPSGCGGMETKLGNILGVILISRFDRMMVAESKLATALTQSRAASGAYSSFCPTFVQNPNSPTALAEHNRLHQAAGAAQSEVTRQKTNVAENGKFLQKKYGEALQGSACIKAVNFDVLKVENLNTDSVNNLIKAETACGAPAKNK